MLKILHLMTGNCSTEKELVLTFKVGNDHRKGENGWIFISRLCQLPYCSIAVS